MRCSSDNSDVFRSSAHVGSLLPNDSGIGHKQLLLQLQHNLKFIYLSLSMHLLQHLEGVSGCSSLAVGQQCV